MFAVSTSMRLPFKSFYSLCKQCHIVNKILLVDFNVEIQSFYTLFDFTSCLDVVFSS